MRFRSYMAALPLLALAGCTGAAGETYLGMPGSPIWFRTASPQTIAAFYSKNCEAYGFKKGTPEMAQCIQSEALNKQSRNTMRAAASSSATCTTFGNTTTCNSY